LEQIEKAKSIEQSKKLKKVLLAQENQPIREQRETARQEQKFWDQMVPGETVFPWVHGTQCEKQQAEMTAKYNADIHDHAAYRLRNEQVGVFKDFRSPKHRKEALIQQMTVMPQTDRMHTLSPHRTLQKNTHSVIDNTTQHFEEQLLRESK